MLTVTGVFTLVIAILGIVYFAEMQSCSGYIPVVDQVFIYIMATGFPVVAGSMVIGALNQDSFLIALLLLAINCVAAVGIWRFDVSYITALDRINEID